MKVAAVAAAAGHAVVGLVLGVGRDGDAIDVHVAVGFRRIQGEAARQALHTRLQRDGDGGRGGGVVEIDRLDLGGIDAEVSVMDDMPEVDDRQFDHPRGTIVDVVAGAGRYGDRVVDGGILDSV